MRGFLPNIKNISGWSPVLFLALALAVASVLPAHARQLSLDEALCNIPPHFSKNATRSSADFLYTEKFDDLNVAYILPYGGGDGFLILAADDLLPAVLGYSDKGDFNEASIPPAMQEWLGEYGRQLTYAVDHNLTASSVVVADNRQPIAPICQTKWNQLSPFNKKCPIISGKYAPTGCTATAMAQVMYAHKWPVTGEGTNSYVSETTGKKLTFDFGNTSFDWEEMLLAYDDTYTASQSNAVATLMAACGNASLMSYGRSASGAYLYDAVYGMVKFLCYDRSARLLERDFYASALWDDIIYSQLKEGFPVVYSGYNSSYDEGHTFVVDGYSENGFYHLNWGWGGLSDGYFLLTALDPTEQGTGGSASGYNYRQSALVGVKPSVGDSDYALEVMCDGSFQPVSKSYTSGEKAMFQVGDNGYFRAFTLVDVKIRMGLLLTPADGGDPFFCEGREVGFSSMYGSYNLGGYRSFSIDVDALPKEGTYIAVPAFEHNGEVRKVAMKVGEMSSVTVNCSDTGVKFEDIKVSRTLSASDVKIDKKLYSGRSCDITAEIHNSGEEYLGIIGAGFMDENGKILCSLPGVVVNLTDDESLTVKFSGMLESGSSELPAGEYIFDLFDEAGNSICAEPTVMTVYAIPIGKLEFTFDLSMLGDYSGDGTYSNPYLIGDNVEMEASVNVTSGLFNDMVALYAYYADGNSAGETDAQFSSSTVSYKEFFVTPEEVEKEIFSLGTSEFELGKTVYVQAYGWKPDWSASSQEWLSSRIYMKRDTNGVDDISVPGCGIYPNPAIGSVLVSEASPILWIKIYALTGAEVRSQDCSGSESSAYIDVSALPSGHYILVASTVSGLQRHRLIKK